MATYADPALSLAPGVTADVGAFIRRTGGVEFRCSRVRLAGPPVTPVM